LIQPEVLAKKGYSYFQLYQSSHTKAEIMQDPNKGLYANITLNDVQLARAYYPILIDLAKHKHCLTYGELVNKAKEMYPDLEYVKNAIAVSTGRKLDVVRLFTVEENLPDITSLIINQSKGECGSGFTDHFDPVEKRAEVYAYDWSEVSPNFDLYIASAEQQAIPKKKIKRAEAKKISFAYYKEHKSDYPSSIRDKREEIIAYLMEGYSVEESYKKVTEHQETAI
jgi:hypothetical protein